MCNKVIKAISKSIWVCYCNCFCWRNRLNVLFLFSSVVLLCLIVFDITFLKICRVSACFFLMLFLFFGKSQPDVSYKGCSYKKGVYVYCTALPYSVSEKNMTSDRQHITRSYQSAGWFIMKLVELRILVGINLRTAIQLQPVRKRSRKYVQGMTYLGLSTRKCLVTRKIRRDEPK